MFKNNENFKWKYFIKPKLIKLSEQKAKPSTVKENLVWKLFGFEVYFEFHSNVRSRDK